SAPAATFKRSSACGPSTRKRHGLVRLWFGAQPARSSSSSSTSRDSGSGLNALWVRRVRIAVSTSTQHNVPSRLGEATAVPDEAADEPGDEEAEGGGEPEGEA